jgi:AraC-like DNA-binding protein
MSETTLELFKAWYVFSFSFGLWTFINISANRKADNYIWVTLLIYVGLLLLPPLNAYVQLAFSKPLPWLTALAYNLTLSYGPLLLILVKQTLLIPVVIKKDAFHFIPLLLLLVDRLLGSPITNEIPFYFTLLFSQATAYCGYSIWLLVKHKRALKSVISGHTNSTYFWLLLLTLSLLTLVFLDAYVVSQFVKGSPPNMPVVLLFSSAIAVYASAIALLSLYQPKIFQTQEIDRSNSSEPIEDLPKVRNIELLPEMVGELDKQLEGLVLKQQPHLDQDINLSKMASMLGITRTQLSEYFNVHKETSFYAFLNDLRYEESIKLLNSSAKNTVTDIAYQAGFNNRNSFFKVFKERSGVTPKDYQMRVRQKKTANG